jgi:hypothetical protein
MIRAATPLLRNSDQAAGYAGSLLRSFISKKKNHILLKINIDNYSKKSIIRMKFMSGNIVVVF